jgi:hypothetical protein
MSKLRDDDVRAIRDMLVGRVRRELQVAPRRRVVRNVVAGVGLVAVGAGGGFGVAVASGAVPSLSNKDLSTAGPTPSPFTYYLSEIPALERAGQPGDALPATMSAEAQSTFLEGSSRRVGESSGVEYFLGLGHENTICLLIFPTNNPKRWTVGCSGGLPFGLADQGFGSARVSSIQATVPHGAVRLSENVVVDTTSNDLSDSAGG